MTNNKVNQTLIKYTFLLVLICVFCAFILSLVYQATASRIKYYTKQNLFSGQKAVLAEATSFEEKNMTGDLLKKFQEFYPFEKETNFYLGKKQNKEIGVIFIVSPQGYGGPIKMLVGISFSGEVAGIKILEQKETPGLGSQITEENFKGSGRPFLAQFIGKTNKDLLQPKKDIDAITGATISTKAVCQGVKNALELFEIYKRGK